MRSRNNGGGIPLGYLLGDEQKLVLDPVTAPIVRETSIITTSAPEQSEKWKKLVEISTSFFIMAIMQVFIECTVCVVGGYPMTSEKCTFG